MEYVRWLQEVSPNDVAGVGGKAAKLGDLMNAGFPVPNGFILTTDAFRCFLTTNSLGSEISTEAVTSASLPAELADALLAAAHQLGDVSLAVRSSGVAEDMAGASFAGQYETVLNVRGADAIVDAVRHCWASTFSERVTTYRKGQEQGEVAPMALLIQQLVPAESAGVAFTANPVTGNQKETLVSAVRGLGERLVSGQVSPDEWVVRGDDVVCQGAPEDAIDAVQARGIAEWRRTSAVLRTSSGPWPTENCSSYRRARLLPCLTRRLSRFLCRWNRHSASGSERPATFHSPSHPCFARFPRLHSTTLSGAPTGSSAHSWKPWRCGRSADGSISEWFLLEGRTGARHLDGSCGCWSASCRRCALALRNAWRTSVPTRPVVISSGGTRSGNQVA